MKPNDVIKKMIELGSNSDVELKKIEQIDGAMEVTFMDNGANGKRKLPKSFEELCASENPNIPRVFLFNKFDFDPYDFIPLTSYENRIIDEMQRFTADRAIAEAFVALQKLILLRDCYNGGWKPNWNKEWFQGHRVDVIQLRGVFEAPGKFEVHVTCAAYTPHLLYFKDYKTAMEFLRNFEDLILKLAPLYGVMKGGKE